jgi:hypothetical protein
MKNYAICYISMTELKLTIPRDLGDIKLEQYQRYLKIYNNWDNEDEDYLKTKMLQVFCDMSPEDVFKIPLSSYDNIIAHLLDLLNSDAPLIQKFTMTGKNGEGFDTEVEFGFIPKLDDMSFGEYIDLEKNSSDWSTMHKAMAVLFRPISHSKKEFYRIDEYEGTSRYGDVMLDMPVSVALGAIGFFLRLGQKLPIYMMDYLEETLEKEELPHQLKQTLEKSGIGINQYIHLLKEMLEDSMKLQRPTFTNVL